jgi:sulfate adenylyltransferase
MANTPHGGALKDLLVRDAGSHEQLLEESRTLQDIFLTEVSPCTSGDDEE